MKTIKSLKRWLVNVVAFIVFAVLSISGLLNFLISSNGHRAGQGGLGHFIREIHEIAALAFVIVISVHILLHWDYIKKNISG